MSNVVSLGGGPPPAQLGEPNPELIKALEDTLAMARSGQLQSMIGTGFSAQGERYVLWADHHGNVYEMLGALAWLQAEYVHKTTEQYQECGNDHP